MPQQNSTPNPPPNTTPQTPRRSARLQIKNQIPQFDPNTPEPGSKSCKFCLDHTPRSDVKKGSFGKLECGLVKCGKENSGFCVRRSSRLSGKGNVVEKEGDLEKNHGFSAMRSSRLSGKGIGVDGLVEKEVLDRKKGRGLSYIGRMEVGFDPGRSGVKEREGRSLVWEMGDGIVKKGPDSEKGKSVTEKRVTRRSIQGKGDDVDENMEIGFHLGRGGLEKWEARSSIRKKGDEIMEKEMNCGKGKSVIEKRVRRSSVQGNGDEIVAARKECEEGLSEAKRAEKGFDLGGRAGGEMTKSEKRVKCGSFLAKLDSQADEGSQVVVKTDLGANSRVDLKSDPGKELICSAGASSMIISKVRAIGLKRKRNEVGESDGWTQEQVVALQKAYRVATPTPRFWKKVAKMVPGKSVQDCYDKIHAEDVTPPQRKRRSRAIKKDESSSFSLSPSMLLKTEDQKPRKATSRKQKGHLAHKRVRQLLEKDCVANQGSEADLFYVFESAPYNLPAKSKDCGVSFSTPKSGKAIKPCLDKSPPILMKPFSEPLGRLDENAHVSPPVLKPLKNKVLHEKYLDQLHCREAKRRAASKKNNTVKEVIQRKEDIKVVKNALLSNAKSFIHEFQKRLEAGARAENSDDDDVDEGFENDDDEDDLE